MSTFQIQGLGRVKQNAPDILVANTRLEIIESAGHNAHSEQSAEAIQAIKNFMAAIN